MNAIRFSALAAGSVLFFGHSAVADVYLVETNPNAAAPYDTWATAATSFSDAFGQLTAGNTLWISNGTYSAAGNGAGYTIPANAAIRSVNGPGSVTLNFGQKKAFELSNAGSVLAGIRVYNSYDANCPGARLKGANTLVTNCVFESCSCLALGGGVYAEKGLVVDTVITKCTGAGWNPNGSFAARLEGTAVFDRCAITNNTRTTTDWSMGAISVTGGTLRNSLVAGNSTYGCSGVQIKANGKVENCTIVANVTRDSRENSYGVWVESATGVLQNSIVTGNVNLDDLSTDIGGVDGWEDSVVTCCIAEDPGFLDAAAKDYHLTPASPCLDKADTLAWMATAKDLDGNPRIDETYPDIGCYEYIWPSERGVMLFRTILGEDAFAPQTDELRAVITPRSLEVDSANCWWTFDGSIPSAENHQAVGTVITNVFGMGTHTVRFRVKVGNDTFGKDETDWFTVLNNKVHLVQENPNAAAPYDTWETAATNLSEALVYLTDGFTLLVSNGTYKVKTGTLAANFVMPKNATIRGVNGAETVTFDYKDQSIGAFKFTNLGATLEGVRIYGCWQPYTPAVQMAFICTIKDCIFDSCMDNGGVSTISASKGLVTGCTFTRCVAGNGYGACALVFSATGSAVIDRCTFVENTRAATSGEANGVVAVSGGGVVRNSLFVRNRAGGCPGVYVGANGTAENCTLVKNVTDKTSATFATSCPLYVADLTGAVKNTIVVQNVDQADNVVALSGIAGFEDCLTTCFLDSDGDPAFSDPLADDYRLQPVSPCVDAATESAWMAGAQDLEGNPRIANDIPDIGCYEYTESTEPGAAIYHTLIGSSEFAPQTNEFRAVITPRSLEYDPNDCWWTFDGTEPSASNHQAVGSVVTNAVGPGSITVRFRVKAGDETYGDDKMDWFSVKSAYVYLVKDNADAQAPYITWATAAATFDAAFQCLEEGQTLIVSNGTYALANNPYTLPKYAGVKSVNGPTNVMFTNGKNGTSFTLSNLGNFLEGVRFYKCGHTSGPAVQMSQDVTVRNCIFDQCVYHSGPGGVVASQGTVVDCLFDKCAGGGWGVTAAIAASGSGQTLFERCRFVGTARAGDYDSQGAVKVSGGATVRNSLVTGGSMGGCSGIHVGAGGRAENCTVVANKSIGTQRASSCAVYAADATAESVNVLSVNNIYGTETVANTSGVASATFLTCFADGDPKFNNIETQDYTLKASSPCVNAGTLLYWMTDDAIDLAGHPRLNGLLPDIGCYEYWESGEISVEIERKQLTQGIYAPQQYEFSATIKPSYLEYDPNNCWWTFDGTEPSASNHQAVGPVVTNVFVAATDPTYTVRFVLKVGDQTYADGHEDWIEVRSDKVFLVSENPNAAAPYATWETAATNFAQAFAWLGQNSTLWLSNGTYYVRYPDATFTIPKNASVRSVNGPDAATLDFSRHQVDPKIGDQVYARAFVMEATGATISGLTIRSVTSVWSPAGVEIKVGANGCLVTNCVFDTCRIMGNSGSAISAKNGRIIDCLITNCTCSSTGNAHTYGLALELNGANTFADRCRVMGAVNTGRALSRCGAVSVTGGATLRNSLVSNCRMAVCSGIYVSKGTVENCTVASNETWAATDENLHAPRALWVGSTLAGVTNTIASLNVDDTGAEANAGGIDGWEATVNTCFLSGDARFKNPAKGNFHLRQNSPCVDKGTVLPWMDGAVDLGGQPRVKGGVPDIGCHEFLPTGLVIVVK